MKPTTHTYASITFYFKDPPGKRLSDELGRDTPHLGKVYANLACNRTHLTFSTGIVCRRDEFKDGRITPKTPVAQKARQDLEDLRVVVSQMGIKPHYNAQIVKSIIQGTYVEGMHEPTLMNAVSYGLDQVYGTLREVSRDQYKSVVNTFREWMNKHHVYRDVAISRVSTSITSQYQVYLIDSGIAPSTISYAMGVLSSLYDRYNEDHPDVVCPENPFRATKKKLSKQTRKTAIVRRRNIMDNHLSEEMIKKILDHEFVDNRKHSHNRWRLTALWQIYTGFAFDDLGSDDWKIVDIKGKKMIELYRGKTGNRCPIPLLPEAERVLGELRQENVKGVRGLFPVGVFNKDGKVNLSAKRRAYGKYNIFLKGFQKKIGVPLRSHLFRHTFGMMMSRRGVPMKTIAEMMGHSSVATTESFYVSPGDEQIIEEVLGIDF